MKEFWPVFAFFGGVWLVALASMLGGSPTAANAVVGIPIGAWLMWTIFYTVNRAERK